MSSSKSNAAVYFILFYCIVQCIQGYYTPLLDDEAYYWVYSEQLAWGYFDHPPIIALLINLGYKLFANTLGVRILSILLGLMTVLLLKRIISPKSDKIFYLLMSSLTLFHAVSCFALPDAPLLFFTAAMLYFFKQFIDSPDLTNGSLLGVSSGLMLLSKYHGLIILLLVMLSNLKYAKTRGFLAAVCCIVILCLPHLGWQIENTFAPLHYHFIERSQEAYSPLFSVQYLIEQLFILGPITGILFFIACFKNKEEDAMSKTLSNLFWGGYIFFFLMSFKGSIEAHWTLFCILPGIYFGTKYLEKKTNGSRIAMTIFGFSIIPITIIRLYLLGLVSLPILDKLDATRFLSAPQQMEIISNTVGKNPVGFMNSYQLASQYQFYTKKPAFSSNNIMGRRNQYSIWKSSELYRDSTIVLIPNYPVPYGKIIEGTPYRKVIIPNFKAVEHYPIESRCTSQNADFYRVELILREYDKFNSHPNQEVSITISWFDNQVLVHSEVRQLRFDQELKAQVTLVKPIPNITLRCYFSIKDGWLPPGFNGKYLEF